MARLPLTLEDPKYHRLLERFAFDAGADLADALLDLKVPKDKAHEAVVTFLFNFAMKFDGGSQYKTDGTYRPQMAFSNGLGQIIVPMEETHLHELAQDIAEQIFNIQGRR